MTAEELDGLGSTCRSRATLPGDETGGTCRSLPSGLPRRPCSAAYGLGPSVFTLRARKRARIAPRFPRPPPTEGPRRSRQCRSGP